jgi:mono/diheme cytochrome c family protein
MKANPPLLNSLQFKLFYTFIFVLIAYPIYSQDGETLFKTNCTVCHTIGKGVLLGPDLANVQLRRDNVWLFKFIRSSQSVIKGGDEIAVALFEKYNNIQMPDQPTFTDMELNAILTYIASQSPEYVPETEEAVAQISDTPVEPEIVGKSVDEATDEDILNGRLLFSGERRLENRGPACISCHHVKNDRLIGGGLLAKDLTDAFTRLNENGIKAMVSNPPFPAMRTAYNNHPIKNDEAFLITAFLKFADKTQYRQHTRDYQAGFLYIGLAGLAFLLFVFTAIWSNRKNAPVNKKIFIRQLKSEPY